MDGHLQQALIDAARAATRSPSPCAFLGRGARHPLPSMTPRGERVLTE
jgi:hypothetical protein